VDPSLRVPACAGCVSPTRPSCRPSCRRHPRAVHHDRRPRRDADQRGTQLTVVRHGLTAVDRVAMTSLRAALAANPIAMTRAAFDGLFERVPPAEAIDYSESNGRRSARSLVRSESAPSRSCAALPTWRWLRLRECRAFRHLAGQIALRAGVPAFVAELRLAPEHEFSLPRSMTARAAYRGLASKHGAERVALAGDSAGGGLALSLLQEEPRAQCGPAVPWTDLALTGRPSSPRR